MRGFRLVLCRSRRHLPLNSSEEETNVEDVIFCLLSLFALLLLLVVVIVVFLLLFLSFLLLLVSLSLSLCFFTSLLAVFFGTLLFTASPFTFVLLFLVVLLVLFLRLYFVLLSFMGGCVLFSKDDLKVCELLAFFKTLSRLDFFKKVPELKGEDDVISDELEKLSPFGESKTNQYLHIF